MLKGFNIVCFSVTDYGHDLPVGKDHLMELFARNGNKVLMVNLVGARLPQATKYDTLKLFRKVKEIFSGCKIINGIYVINPLRIPLVKSRYVNALNAMILQIYLIYYFNKLSIRRPIFWTLSIFYSDLMKKFNHSAIIYYVSDDYAYFTGNAIDTFIKYENKTIHNSDGIITVHTKIFNRISMLHKNVINILNSTNPEHFTNNRSKDIPYDLKNINKPIVGFSGKIEDWIDIELIKDCALYYPEYSFVLIGPEKINVDSLKKVKNIYLLGRKSYEELPKYINNFDVCISPFIKNKVTESMDFPLKIVEYLASGKPVVSINTKTPERYINCLYLCNSKQEFIKQIEYAIKTDDPDYRNSRMQVALENSWLKRAEELSEWINKFIRL